MEALPTLGAAFLALRLTGSLAGCGRERRAPHLAVWSLSLLAFAFASAALAWGAAYGWGEAAFRVYYLCGAMLTAALLGAGSLLLAGRRWALPVALLYAGLATGLALAEPLAEPVSGTTIPDASEHLDFIPARLVAVLGNSLGTLAVAVVAITTARRRPLGNALVLAGVLTAAGGSALFGLGVAQSALSLALAVGLLYAGFVVRPRRA